MATNCDSCGHRTNEVSWAEGRERSSVPVSLSSASHLGCWGGRLHLGLLRPLSQLWRGLWLLG